MTFFYVSFSGSSVIQVQATDADNGINAVMEYFIQKGGYDDFGLDNSTGIVSVKSKLDFDRRNTYNMEIVAVDHGVPSLTGTTTLTINIINTNDKLPYFVPSTQTAEVSCLHLNKKMYYIFSIYSVLKCVHLITDLLVDLFYQM